MYLRFRRWLCRHLYWHKPAIIYFNFGEGPDGQAYGTCRFCGYEGMIDSQGNLF